MINLTEYYVTEIKTKQAEYMLGHKGEIKDEGSFYRVDGSFILDKCRITSIEVNENILIVHSKNEDIILTVEKKNK